MKPKIRTLPELLSGTADYLRTHGIESARLDAELLLAHVLGFTRIQLYTQWDRPLSENELKSFKILLERRVRREPLAYILGKREFYSLEFYVSPAVLVPRPETELLVEETLRLAQKLNLRAPLILDMGTGSGCVAIALAKQLPQAHLWAWDVSEEALKLALLNAKRHGVEHQITFLHQDFTLYPSFTLHEKFDFILSNPPYIPSEKIQTLAPEIQFEPQIALDGGVEGLDAYPFLFSFAFAHLKDRGAALWEMGENQSEKIRFVSEKVGFRQVEFIKDLVGIKRIVKCRLPFRSA